MIYLELLWSFFQIGLFSIGGGYAAMPLIQEQVVNTHNWLSMTEFADVITISQMTPGPIAINSATFVGMRIAGLPGALVATLGCVLPSFFIVLGLAYLYYKFQNLSLIQGVLSGLRPAVVALIGCAGLSILLLSLFDGAAPSLQPSDINFISGGIFLVCLVVLRKWKPNPIYVMLGAGVLGACIFPFVG